MKARVAASIVLALGLGLGMSGCTLITLQDTKYVKESSVGVGGSVGEVDIRNAVIVSDSNGTVGNLVVTFVNNEGKPHFVSVQHGSTTRSVAVPAYGVKKVGEEGGTRVRLPQLGAKPGSLTDLYFSYQGVTGTRLRVPVVSSSFPGFEGYSPDR